MASALKIILLAVLLLALLVLQIVILVRQPSKQASSEPVLATAAALMAAEDTATAHVFEELSLFAGNLTALDAARSSPMHGGPLRVARALAIVHIAMADAIGAATRAFVPYTGLPYAEEPTSECAAAIAAAHGALASLYPAFVSQIVLFTNRLRNAIAETDAKQRGIELGVRAANLVLALRAQDGAAHAEPPAADFESVEPGKWRRDPVAQHGVALGGLWAERVAPFVIESASQFRLPAPPAPDSADFALEFAELAALGGDGNHTATVRHAWGTMVGLYWAYDGTGNVCAPPRLYLQLAIEVARRRQLPMLERVRMLATAAIAMADTGLAAWDSKYYHRRARPVTFLRDDADVDGNPLTYATPGWQPLGAPASNSLAPNFTPPFPAYPSGHAAFGSAVMQVIRTFLNSDQFNVTFISSEFDGITRDNRGHARPRIERTFDTGAQIEQENADSRIMLGIHWRHDCTAGMLQGNSVARYITDRLYPTLLRAA